MHLARPARNASLPISVSVAGPPHPAQ